MAGGIVGQKVASGVGSAATQAKTRLLPESSFANQDVINAVAGKDLSKNLRQEDINALSRIQQNASYDVSQDATGKMVPFAPSENNPLGLNAVQLLGRPSVTTLANKLSTSPKSAAIASDEMVAQQAQFQKLQNELVAQAQNPDVKTLEDIGVNLRKNTQAQLDNIKKAKNAQISILDNYPISIRTPYGQEKTNYTVSFSRGALSKELQKIDTKDMGIPMPDILNSTIKTAGELARNMPEINAFGQKLYKNKEYGAKKALDSYIGAIKSSLPEKAQSSLERANRYAQDIKVLNDSDAMAFGDIESKAYPIPEGQPGTMYKYSDAGLAARLFNGEGPAIDQWDFLKKNLGDTAATNLATSRIQFELSQANSIPELKSAIARYDGLFSAAPDLKAITEKYSKGMNDLAELEKKLNPSTVPLSVNEGGMAIKPKIGGYAGTLVFRLFTGRGPEFQNAVNDRISAALKGSDPELASKIFAIASKYKKSGLKGQTLDALKNDFNKLIESTSVTIGSNQDLNSGEK